MSAHSLKSKILSYLGSSGWILAIVYLLNTPMEEGTIIPIQVVVAATVMMIAGYGALSRRIGKIQNAKAYSIATTLQSVLPFALTAFILRETAVHLDVIMTHLIIMGSIVGGARAFKIVAAFIDDIPETLSEEEVVTLKEELLSKLDKVKGSTPEEIISSLKLNSKGGSNDGSTKRKKRTKRTKSKPKPVRKKRVIRTARSTSNTKNSV